MNPIYKRRESMFELHEKLGEILTRARPETMEAERKMYTECTLVLAEMMATAEVAVTELNRL